MSRAPGPAAHETVTALSPCKQALESNPKNADVMDAMATFLAEQRNSPDRAAEMRRQAQLLRDVYG